MNKSLTNNSEASHPPPPSLFSSVSRLSLQGQVGKYLGLWVGSGDLGAAGQCHNLPVGIRGAVTYTLPPSYI